jgi:hypothetical protein
MIIDKFEQLSIPINEIYTKLDYRNIESRNKINEIIAKKKLIHNFDEDIDDFILYAINYYDNLNNFIVFGLDKNESYKYFVTNFNTEYSLYGIKHINIKSTMIIKVMYQLLFPRMIIKSIIELKEYLYSNYSFLANYDKEFIDITILVVRKKDNTKKYPTADIINEKYTVYIPNTKESIWNSASIFFSNTSLQFLELQNFDYFLTKDMEKSKKMFLKYRSWLNSNILYKDQMQFMLFSSIVLYLIGNRLMNDLDLYIHTIPSHIIEVTDQLKDPVFNYIEYKIKNTGNWPDYWNSWLDIWANKCGAKYFEEILGNPRYHFYFLGVKIISLNCDIVRRIERARPRAIADLIALRKRYPLSISIPSLKEKIVKFIPIKDKSTEEIAKLINDGGVLNEENKEISIEVKHDINKTINTIIYILKERYRMTFSEAEIKRELNMDNEIRISHLSDSMRRIKITIKKKM